mgnify:CR=1 FL=1
MSMHEYACIPYANTLYTTRLQQKSANGIHTWSGGSSIPDAEQSKHVYQQCRHVYQLTARGPRPRNRHPCRDGHLGNACQAAVPRLHCTHVIAAVGYTHALLVPASGTLVGKAEPVSVLCSVPAALLSAADSAHLCSYSTSTSVTNLYAAEMFLAPKRGTSASATVLKFSAKAM